jgi:hypothetical protein
MPESEWSRRRTNEVPRPLRNGATPCTAPFSITGALELAVEATNRSYDFLFVSRLCTGLSDDDKITFYYPVKAEAKSRKQAPGSGGVAAEFAAPQFSPAVNPNPHTLQRKKQ